MGKNQFIVVFITARDAEEAKKISTALVDQRLIACANVVSGVQSIFSWQGKIDQADEVLMILKTKKSVFSKLVKTVKSLHSYDVSEIIALPILAGSRDYLEWVNQSAG